MAKGDYKIPFDTEGNQMHYPYGVYPELGRWEDNRIFEDTLKFEYFSRGCSAAYANLVSLIDGKKYTMFLVDLETCFLDFKHGKAEGKWTFCKRGQNFGIRRAGQ